MTSKKMQLLASYIVGRSWRISHIGLTCGRNWGMHHLQNKKSFESVEEIPTSLIKVIDVKIICNNFTFIQKLQWPKTTKEFEQVKKVKVYVMWIDVKIVVNIIVVTFVKASIFEKVTTNIRFSMPKTQIMSKHAKDFYFFQ
jgi:hypothetical protein